jgi:hypothetical protein
LFQESVEVADLSLEQLVALEVTEHPRAGLRAASLIVE